MSSEVPPNRTSAPASGAVSFYSKPFGSVSMATGRLRRVGGALSFGNGSWILPIPHRIVGGVAGDIDAIRPIGVYDPDLAKRTPSQFVIGHLGIVNASFDASDDHL